MTLNGSNIHQGIAELTYQVRIRRLLERFNFFCSTNESIPRNSQF